jgi:cytochrome c oxidase subunit II
MLIYQLNFDAMEVEVDNALAQRGQEISTQEGCIACHTVDGSLGVGPSWQGMIGRIETLDNGTSIVVDEVYFLESIRYAKRKMVDGYPNVMPSYMMEEEEIDALFAFASQLSQ